MSFKVYLAGPITGLTFGDAESWRLHVKKIGADFCQAVFRDSEIIRWYSPMRQQEHLAHAGVLKATHDDSNPMTSKHGLMTRDAWDVQTCDMVLCNLLGAPRISIGTMIEIGMAYSLRKPTVLVIENSGNVHEHSMLDNAWTFRTNNLDNGIKLACDILLP